MFINDSPKNQTYFLCVSYYLCRSNYGLNLYVSFCKEICMLLFSIFCLYDLRKIFHSLYNCLFFLSKGSIVRSLRILLIDIFRRWIMCFLSWLNACDCSSRRKKKKVVLGVLERSVKAPQAEQTVQDNTLAWC